MFISVSLPHCTSLVVHCNNEIMWHKDRHIVFTTSLEKTGVLNRCTTSTLLVYTSPTTPVDGCTPHQQQPTVLVLVSFTANLWPLANVPLLPPIDRTGVLDCWTKQANCQCTTAVHLCPTSIYKPESKSHVQAQCQMEKGKRNLDSLKYYRPPPPYHHPTHNF